MTTIWRSLQETTVKVMMFWGVVFSVTLPADLMSLPRLSRPPAVMSSWSLAAMTPRVTVVPSS